MADQPAFSEQSPAWVEGAWTVYVQVYNLTTYPHLVGLLEELGVQTEPSEMSFAFSDQGSGLEWASHGLSAIFAKWRSCISPSFLLMVYDVVRFGQQAPKVGLHPGRASSVDPLF